MLNWPFYLGITAGFVFLSHYILFVNLSNSGSESMTWTGCSRIISLGIYSPSVRRICLCLQEIWCIPPYEDLPLMATTPFFTRSEILVEGIGMQVEELHSGVTRISPVLGFLTLVSLNLMCHP